MAKNGGAVTPQKLSVSKVKSNLLNVAQSSYYRVTIPVPPDVKAKLNSKTSLTTYDYENINLLCCEASLPGSSLTTHEANNDYHGVTEKMAYRRMYDEVLSLTFYIDRDYKVIEMLEGWMNYITGVSDTQTYENPYVGYRMAYPNSYKSNKIYLTKFERDQFVRDFNIRGGSSTTTRSILEYTFVKAFPLSLTAIPVSYESGEVLKCNVSFNYIRYVMNKKGLLVTDSGVQERTSIVNRDPTLGANDLLGTAANFS